jgi:ribosomal protein L11 methyltransferase
MYSVTFYPDELNRDFLSAELFDLGCEGISESSISLRAFFADRGLAESAAAAYLQWDPDIDYVEDKDYTEDWQGQWQPVPVGERFFLVPDWRDDPAPAGRLRLPVHPGQAFGTGRHASTQLCLEAMERLPVSGRDVLDVGTGSGILATAACLLGAGSVRACDNDSDSAAVAQENCRADGVQVDVYAGSIQDAPAESADILLANILGPTHHELRDEYLRVLRPGGHLILSGFEDHEADAVQAAVPIPFVHDLRQDTWRALVFIKP